MSTGIVTGIVTGIGINAGIGIGTDPAPTPPAPAVTGTPAAPAAATAPGARILVVDDDAGSRRLTRATLQRCGFQVTEAANGRLAVASAQQAMPELVLMDVSMPEMDGFEACAALRALPGGDQVPVAMMTGLDDVRSIERAFEVGATDFITKPINWSVLPHRVRYMLRASAAINELQQHQRRLSNAQRIGEMGDWEWDLHSDQVVASPQAAQLLGMAMLPPGPQPTTLLFGAVHPEDLPRLRLACDQARDQGEGFGLEHRVLLADGQVRHVHQQVEVAGGRQADGRIVRLAGAVHDITRRKEAEEHIRRLAYFDALTGLPNRLQFTEQLGQALQKAQAQGSRVAIMFVDLDNFKRVNDTLGHSAGDELLRLVSARLAHSLRRHDLLARDSLCATDHSIARLGGDEFIVLLPDIAQPEDAVAVAQRLVQTMAEPVTVEGTEVFVGGSVGVALYPDDGDTIDTLLMHADTAMYRAKASGRGGFQRYDSAMNARSLDQLHMDTQLRRALERDEFVLHYQPRVDVMSGRIVGAEALIRWQHPQRGLLQPGEFIHLVEAAGLVIAVGEWAIEAACRQNAAWRRAGHAEIPIAVNLASTHLRERGLPGLVAEVLARHDIAATALEIEVTESLLLTEPELSLRIAQELSDMGVQLSIDDFGTGYSSLGYLKRLPIGSLKIDRSFVRDLDTDPDDEAIVGAIIALAHSLKLKVVAEGVETPSQLRFLQMHHCDEYQGFLTSRAIQPDEFAVLLAQAQRPLLPLRAA